MGTFLRNPCEKIAEAQKSGFIAIDNGKVFLTQITDREIFYCPFCGKKFILYYQTDNGYLLIEQGDKEIFAEINLLVDKLLSLRGYYGNNPEKGDEEHGRLRNL